MPAAEWWAHRSRRARSDQTVCRSDRHSTDQAAHRWPRPEAPGAWFDRSERVTPHPPRLPAKAGGQASPRCRRVDRPDQAQRRRLATSAGPPRGLSPPRRRLILSILDRLRRVPSRQVRPPADSRSGLQPFLVTRKGCRAAGPRRYRSRPRCRREPPDPPPRSARFESRPLPAIPSSP